MASGRHSLIARCTGPDLHRQLPCFLGALGPQCQVICLVAIVLAYDEYAGRLGGTLCAGSPSTKGGLLEEPVKQQLLMLVIYMRAVYAAIYGQHSDVLG